MKLCLEEYPNNQKEDDSADIDYRKEEPKKSNNYNDYQFQQNEQPKKSNNYNDIEFEDDYHQEEKENEYIKKNGNDN